VSWIGIDVPREELYRRIELRTQGIFAGLVEEARQLAERGLGDSPAARALGISEAQRLIAGELSREEALALTVQATRRYAKRQLTWFRKVKQIRWLSPGEVPSGIP
jgi:tRNA dimethylallyltransferase